MYGSVFVGMATDGLACYVLHALQNIMWFTRLGTACTDFACFEWVFFRNTAPELSVKKKNKK